MLVKEIMTNVVGCVGPECFVTEAAQKMSSLNIGFLPVFNGQVLVGIVTDRDIVMRTVAKREEIYNTRIYNIMTPRVEWVFEDQSVEEAARIMALRQVRRLPVINKDEMLVGIVSITDILQKCDKNLAVEVLDKVCTRC